VGIHGCHIDKAQSVISEFGSDCIEESCRCSEVSFVNIAEGVYKTPYTVKQPPNITVSGLSSITTDQITRFQTFEIESNQPK
jgi:hypothetical protein